MLYFEIPSAFIFFSFPVSNLVQNLIVVFILNLLNVNSKLTHSHKTLIFSSKIVINLKSFYFSLWFIRRCIYRLSCAHFYYLWKYLNKHILFSITIPAIMFNSFGTASYINHFSWLKVTRIANRSTLFSTMSSVPFIPFFLYISFCSLVLHSPSLRHDTRSGNQFFLFLSQLQ